MVIVLIGIVLFVIPYVLKWNQKNETKGRKWIGIIILSAYIITVWFVTLGSRSYSPETHVYPNPIHHYVVMYRGLRRSVSFQDFCRRLGWYKGQMENTGLNVLLFVPLGYLLPSVAAFFRRWWKVVLLGLAASLTIETVQLITHLGWFDASDLLHNTVGALIGYGLYKAILRKPSND